MATRDKRLEQELESRARFAPSPKAPGNLLQIVQPLAGDPDNNVPFIGVDIPVSIVHRIDQKCPVVSARLEQIVDPDDDVRILTATPPGTGGITTVDHDVTLGYIEVRDLKPVFFNNGVTIRSDQASTNQFIPPPAHPLVDSGSDAVFLDVSSGVQRETYYKFEKSVTNITGIVIITGIIIAEGEVETGRTGGRAQGLMKFHAIKTSLDLGATFGLDKITWDSGNHTSGTLFGNAANFDGNGPFNITRVSGAGGGDPPGFSISGQQDGTPDGIAKGRYVAFNPALTNGPYTGIMMFIINQSIDLENEVIQGDIPPNIRLDIPDQKAFILGSVLLG